MSRYFLDYVLMLECPTRACVLSVCNFFFNLFQPFGSACLPAIFFTAEGIMRKYEKNRNSMG